VDDSKANNRAQQFTQKREEYDELKRLLTERVEEVNANNGNLPEFLIKGSRIEPGRFTLCLEFDELPTDPTEYVLILKVGVEDNKRPMFGSGPTPLRYRLRAGVSDDSSRILWEGYLGLSNSDLDRLTSAALVQCALDLLTSYYRMMKTNYPYITFSTR
jgi:hypothetical protein